jgi:hypothetical protein
MRSLDPQPGYVLMEKKTEMWEKWVVHITFNEFNI